MLNKLNLFFLFIIISLLLFLLMVIEDKNKIINNKEPLGVSDVKLYQLENEIYFFQLKNNFDRDFFSSLFIKFIKDKTDIKNIKEISNIGYGKISDMDLLDLILMYGRADKSNKFDKDIILIIKSLELNSDFLYIYCSSSLEYGIFNSIYTKEKYEKYGYDIAKSNKEIFEYLIKKANSQNIDLSTCPENPTIPIQVINIPILKFLTKA